MGLKFAAAVVGCALLAMVHSYGQSVDPAAKEPLQHATSEYMRALANWGNGTSETNEELLNSALAIRKLWLGSDNPAVAEVLERLGALHYNRKSYKLAEGEFRQALAIYTRATGLNAPETLHTMGDLGAALREQGRYAEAKPIVEQSVALRRSLLPPNDPFIAGGLTNLGRLYMDMGHAREARQVLEESLAIVTARQDADQLVREDQSLLAVLDAADARVRWLTSRALAAGLGMLMFGAIIIGCVLAAERSYAKKPPSAPPAYIVPIVMITRMGAMLAALFCGAGAALAILLHLGGNSREFPYAPIIGGVAAVGLFPFLLQIAINIARPWAGLEPLPFAIFGRPEREPLWPGHAPSRTSAIPWFPATELTRGRGGTLFKVFVAPRALCGARIDPLWGIFMGGPGQALDTALWTQSAQACAYNQVSPESEDFRRLDKANFQIAWNDITSLAYSPSRQWLAATRPTGGMLTLVLRGGEARTLNLLGKQNGEALRDALERYRIAAVAGNTILAVPPDSTGAV